MAVAMVTTVTAVVVVAITTIDALWREAGWRRLAWFMAQRINTTPVKKKARRLSSAGFFDGLLWNLR